MRKFAILILHFFIAQSLLAQTFEKMFTAFPASMTIVESHDSTFLVGYHAEYNQEYLMVGKTSNGIKLIRLNSSLDTIWTRSLSTDFFYYNFEMYEMQDSTLILSGEAPFGFPTHFMGSIYHLDREGNILWQSPHEESPLASSFSCDFRDSLIYSVSNTGGANFDSVLKITCYDFFNDSVIWQKVVTDSILYGSVKLFANSTRVTDSGIIVAGFEQES